MGELKVRQLDDHIIDTLKARAAAKGLSLEEEVPPREANLAAPNSTARASSGKSGMPWG